MVSMGEQRACERHGSTRFCVGCGVRVARSRAHELVRLVLVPADDGAVTVVADLGGGAVGRGAWVHPTRSCLERATERGG